MTNLCRCIRFINGLSIESKSYLTHRQALRKEKDPFIEITHAVNEQKHQQPAELGAATGGNNCSVAGTYLSFTVRLHEFVECSMPFDFELDHRAILTGHLQVNVVVLRLHSFLQQQTTVDQPATPTEAGTRRNPPDTTSAQ